jgi:DNA gyrase B
VNIWCTVAQTSLPVAHELLAWDVWTLGPMHVAGFGRPTEADCRRIIPLAFAVPIHMQADGVTVEVALQWCSDSYSDTLIGFVNSIKTIDGGTHMDGMKAALSRMLNVLARKTKVLKDGDPNLSGDHIREGLGAIISVKVGAGGHRGLGCVTVKQLA